MRSMSLLTGLDVDAKAALFTRTVRSGAAQASGVDAVVAVAARSARRTHRGTGQCSAALRHCGTPIRRLSGGRSRPPPSELALASFPGFTMTAPPEMVLPTGFEPGYVDAAEVEHQVAFASGWSNSSSRVRCGPAGCR